MGALPIGSNRRLTLIRSSAFYVFRTTNDQFLIFKTLQWVGITAYDYVNG